MQSHKEPKNTKRRLWKRSTISSIGRWKSSTRSLSSGRRIWNGSSTRRRCKMKKGANIIQKFPQRWNNSIATNCLRTSRISKTWRSKESKSNKKSMRKTGISTTKSSIIRSWKDKRKCKETFVRLNSRRSLSLESSKRTKFKLPIKRFSKIKPSNWSAIWTSKW